MSFNHLKIEHKGCVRHCNQSSAATTKEKRSYQEENEDKFESVCEVSCDHGLISVKVLSFSVHRNLHSMN